MKLWAAPLQLKQDLADPVGCSAAAMTEGLAEPDLPGFTGKHARLSLRSG